MIVGFNHQEIVFDIKNDTSQALKLNRFSPKVAKPTSKNFRHLHDSHTTINSKSSFFVSHETIKSQPRQEIDRAPITLNEVSMRLRFNALFS